MQKASPAVEILRAIVGYRESLKQPDQDLQVLRFGELNSAIAGHPHGAAIAKAIELAIDHFPKIVLLGAFVGIALAQSIL